MEALVSTTAASAPLSSARVHRRPLTRSVAFRAQARRGWRCRSAAPPRPDPVPSEEPASGSATTTTVVTDKPNASAGEEKSGEVSAGSGGFVEVTVDAPVSPPEAPQEGGGVDDVLSKLDIEVTPTYVILGGGTLIALLVLSKIISAIDSVPLLPNVLEIVGTGYSIWFTTRYLLFKESRDELFAKFEDLKDMII